MKTQLAVLSVLALPAACDTKPATRSIPEIVKSIGSADHAGRQKFAVELRAHGKAAVSAWIELLENKQDDYNLHVVAAGELGALGADAAAAVPALVKFLRDGYPGMKPGDMTLHDRVKTPDVSRQPSRSALTSIGGPAVAAVRELLKDKSGRVRQEAATTLGGIGSGAAAAVPELIGALGDADKAAAIFAAWALGEIQIKTAEVQSALVAAFRNEEALVRFEAARAIGKFGKDAAARREEVRKLAGDSDTGVRQMALEVLKQLPEPSPAGKSDGAPDKK